jgi:hypothetical protein
MKEHEEKGTYGLAFVVYKSDADGTLVVHIDTGKAVEENERGPMIRVYLNDGWIFENPPYPRGEEKC